MWIIAEGVGGAEVVAEPAPWASPDWASSPDARSVEDAVVDLFPLTGSAGAAESVGVDAVVSLMLAEADCSVIATSFNEAWVVVGTVPVDSSRAT